MIVQVDMRCESETSNFDSPCPALKLYPSLRQGGSFVAKEDLIPLEDVSAAMAARMLAEGWVTIDGKHLCPRHTPDKIGNVIQLGGEYVPIGDGWEARVPDGGENTILAIEVRRVPDATASADTLA